MNEAILRINDIPIYGFGLLIVFSFLWGSFVYYKKAAGTHYEDRDILDSVVLAGFWGFILGRLIFAFLNFAIFAKNWSRLFLLTNYPGLDRWGLVAGICLGLFLCTRRIKAKFLDWFDLVCLGISAGTSVFYAGLAILTFHWQYLLLAVLYLLAFIYFWKAEETYRFLDWYRYKKTSVKSGYIAGLSFSVWGLLYLIELIVGKNLSWQYGLWSGGLFVGGLILVYIRSGRTVADDIKIIFKHGKK